MGDSLNNRINPDRERLGRMMLTNPVKNRVSGERERLGRMSLGGIPRKPKRNKIILTIIVSALIITGIAIIVHKHSSRGKKDSSPKDGTLVKSDEVSPNLTDAPTPGIDVVGDATPTVEVKPDEYLIKSLERMQTGMEQGEYKQVISGMAAVYCLRHDGTIEVFGCDKEADAKYEEIYADWKDIASITLLPYHYIHSYPKDYTWESILGIKKDGSVQAVPEVQKKIDFSEWKNIAWITAPLYCGEIIGVTSEREIMSDGDGYYEGYSRAAVCKALKGCLKVVYRNVDGEDIYGLTPAGKVLRYGYVNDSFGSEEFHDWDGNYWTDIADITINIDGCYALTKDGKVLYGAGRDVFDMFYSEDVYAWSDVVSIVAGYNHIVALKKDGTLYVAEDLQYQDYGQCDVSEWKNIVRIEAWYRSTVGYDSEGKVYFAGYNCLEDALLEKKE